MTSSSALQHFLLICGLLWSCWCSDVVVDSKDCIRNVVEGLVWECAHFSTKGVNCECVREFPFETFEIEIRESDGCKKLMCEGSVCGIHCECEDRCSAMVTMDIYTPRPTPKPTPKPTKAVTTAAVTTTAFADLLRFPKLDHASSSSSGKFLSKTDILWIYVYSCLFYLFFHAQHRERTHILKNMNTTHNYNHNQNQNSILSIISVDNCANNNTADSDSASDAHAHAQQSDGHLYRKFNYCYLYVFVIFLLFLFNLRFFIPWTNIWYLLNVETILILILYFWYIVSYDSVFNHSKNSNADGNEQKNNNNRNDKNKPQKHKTTHTNTVVDPKNANTNTNTKKSSKSRTKTRGRTTTTATRMLFVHQFLLCFFLLIRLYSDWNNANVNVNANANAGHNTNDGILQMIFDLSVLFLVSESKSMVTEVEQFYLKKDWMQFGSNMVMFGMFWMCNMFYRRRSEGDVDISINTLSAVCISWIIANAIRIRFIAKHGQMYGNVFGIAFAMVSGAILMLFYYDSSNDSKAVYDDDDDHYDYEYYGYFVAVAYFMSISMINRTLDTKKQSEKEEH